jgi:hypothetical protein
LQTSISDADAVRDAHVFQTREPLISAEDAAAHDFAADLQAICAGQPVPPDAVAVMKSSDGRNGFAKKAPYLAFLVPERGRYLWMRSWEAWGLRKCSLCGARRCSCIVAIHVSIMPACDRAVRRLHTQSTEVCLHNLARLTAPPMRAEYARTYRFFRLNTLNYYGADACARFKSQCDCCEPLYMRFHIKEKKGQDEIKALVQSADIDEAIKGKRHDIHFDQARLACPSLPAAHWLSRDAVSPACSFVAPRSLSGCMHNGTIAACAAAC